MGIQIRFEGHSHKRTYPNQPSPLIVEITYDLQGSNDNSYTSLYPPERSTWSWRDYTFDLVDWEYGVRVDLEVRRRVLVPIGESRGRTELGPREPPLDNDLPLG